MREDFQEPNKKEQGPHFMTSKPMHCDGDNCGRPAMTTIELRFLCVDHFVSFCYDRLNQCRPLPFCDPDDDSIEANERFLRQCSDQAAYLLRPLLGLDNLDRARLFDILLWASELCATRVAANPNEMSER
jgi:hypothetical protein